MIKIQLVMIYQNHESVIVKHTGRFDKEKFHGYFKAKMKMILIRRQRAIKVLVDLVRSKP